MYTFQDGSPPSLPADYDSSSTTQEQDIKQILINQQAELNLLYYEVNHNQIRDDSLHTALDSVNSSLQTLITQGNTGSSTLQDSNTQMLTSLKSIERSLDIQHDTNAMLDTWGTIYVPLILVITMLWWFFRQFLSGYK